MKARAFAAVARLVAPKPRKTAGSAHGALVLRGDSIMAGGIADLLHRRAPELWIVDRSIAGDTALGAEIRMAYEPPVQTRTVVIQHGTNDIGAGNDPVPSIARMAARASKEGARVILTGITARIGPINMNVYAANIELRRLAKSKGYTFANWDFIPLISYDGLHPDPAMQHDLVEALHQALT